MYLGQLAKIRAELQASKITVVLDARDEEELRNHEGDAEQSEADIPLEVTDARVADQVINPKDTLFILSIDYLKGFPQNRRQFPR
jgi:hypothetical protein